MKTARICVTVFIVFLFAHPNQAQAKPEFFQSGDLQKNTIRAQIDRMITAVNLTGSKRGITFALPELMSSVKTVMATSKILSIKKSLMKRYPASLI